MPVTLPDTDASPHYADEGKQADDAKDLNRDNNPEIRLPFFELAVSPRGHTEDHEPGQDNGKNNQDRRAHPGGRAS
jgi:hypothetical protein